jgi:valine--pyruvate aminotransferase
VPEYIGYANQGLDPDCFVAMKPLIEDLGGNIFKYRIDFDKLRITPDIAAICLSCPTNPSGNVVDEGDLNRLRKLAAEHGIPLLLDQAYGRPFPGAIYVDWSPVWDPGMIVSLSLSKLGLPGTRTSVIVADEKYTQALASMNAVVALANGNLGQHLVSPLLEGDALVKLSREVIRPFYEKKCIAASDCLHQALRGRADYALHAAEGAFFLWLWVKGLPIIGGTLRCGSSAERFSLCRAITFSSGSKRIGHIDTSAYGSLTRRTIRSCARGWRSLPMKSPK